MSSTKQMRFTAETNAAWYALSPFVNPLDCSKRVSFRDENGAWQTIVKPLNLNEDLNRFFNGEAADGEPYRPRWFSKRQLEEHIQGGEVYYYRSAYNGTPRTGYGNSLSIQERLGFAPEILAVDGKARRYPWIGIMLLCADIDAHQGEPDAGEVAQWLLDTYFPGCYAETSTSGSGVHLYVKLAFNPFQFRYRDDTLEHVIGTMNKLAKRIDSDRAAAGFRARIDGLRGLPSQFVPDGNKIRIKRSSCIKIPRFRSGLPDIISFHAAPFFLFSALEHLLDEHGQDDTRVPLDSSDVLNRVFSLEVETRKLAAQLRISGATAKPLNSVYPSYEERLRELAVTADAYDRSLGFMLAYSRHLRRIPSVEEALEEYSLRGLNTGEDKDGKRRSRFDFLRRLVAKTFDASKCGFRYCGFEAERQSLMTEIDARLHPRLVLHYSKARGRRGAVTILDLAILLFAMRKSQGEQETTEFGYRSIRAAFKEIMGGFGSRNKATCLLRALEDLRFIEQVANHCAGLRSRRWRVR